MNKHRVFISYKYSEARGFRDKLLKKLGNLGHYYTGETSDSPDLTGQKTNTIKSKLSDLIYSTSVTIVLITPNTTKSKWIPWEINYSLREIRRANRNSKRNGIIAVVCPINGNDYSYVINNDNGSRTVKKSRLPSIINKNRYNYLTRDKYKTSINYGSYISVYRWDDFCNHLEGYIDIAYKKSTDYIEEYDLTIRE